MEQTTRRDAPLLEASQVILAAQLGGTLSLERHQGTRVTLTFAPPQMPTASA
jgi:hypothetical protein